MTPVNEIPSQLDPLTRIEGHSRERQPEGNPGKRHSPARHVAGVKPSASSTTGLGDSDLEPDWKEAEARLHILDTLA